jgi:outer membrane protein OmpA-like peptidoglycan-associated protein
MNTDQLRCSSRREVLLHYAPKGSKIEITVKINLALGLSKVYILSRNIRLRNPYCNAPSFENRKIEPIWFFNFTRRNIFSSTFFLLNSPQLKHQPRSPRGPHPVRHPRRFSFARQLKLPMYRHATPRKRRRVRTTAHSGICKEDNLSRGTRLTKRTRPKVPKWLLEMVLAVLFVGVLLWVANWPRPSVNNAVNTAATATSNVASRPSNPADAGESLGAFVKASIPGGADLTIPENGMENKLLVYLKDPNAKADRETWFEFDRLNFATGLANLQPSSQDQLESIAKILRAYPKVRVQIGAYTEKQYEAAAKLTLSQGRANAVMAQLIAFGIDPLRLNAKGYTQDHPVANNSTEEGRARNTRIALRVILK